MNILHVRTELNRHAMFGNNYYQSVLSHIEHVINEYGRYVCDTDFLQRINQKTDIKDGGELWFILTNPQKAILTQNLKIDPVLIAEKFKYKVDLC